MLEWWTGQPVPANLDVDHTCCNRACCNPAHLERVTHAENVRRAARRRSWREIRDYQLRLAHLDAIQKEL
ncbi:MAG: HNH endonuclease [Caulobacteraceae bacterium]|nr:HNH endonuclease [Caulobacteraceae bacterium]